MDIFLMIAYAKDLNKNRDDLLVGHMHMQAKLMKQALQTQLNIIK